MAAKRVFPPEWYAAQAARRKQRAEAPKTKSSKKSSSVTKKKDSLHQVNLYSNAESGDKRVNRVEFVRKTKDGSTVNRSYRNVSEASMQRLARVLKARMRNKTAKKTWDTYGGKGASVAVNREGKLDTLNRNRIFRVGKEASRNSVKNTKTRRIPYSGSKRL